ncbi:hypothetical protein [Streptomyces sp. Da 82-17]|uniref:F0F1 ATP synthase subunit B family protein n=1 Tax=Streptomyces sp. Da 82-17 TaxID=3377116 RepID=UPI0038D40ABA
MFLIPEELDLKIGPLNPRVEDLVVAAVLFGVVFLLFRAVLVPRIARVLAERQDRMGDVAGGLYEEIRAVRAERDEVLAGARHEAARIRQRAVEEGAGLVASARAEALRERGVLLASGQAEIAAERAAAEAALRAQVPDLATELAGRVLGEPVSTRA